MRKIDLSDASYTPVRFLNRMHEIVGVKNDAQLAKKMEVNACAISKIRNRAVPIGATYIVTLLELTGMQLGELYALLWV